MASAAPVRSKSCSGVLAKGKHTPTDARRQMLRGNARRFRPGEAESDNSLDSRKGSVEPFGESHEYGGASHNHGGSPSFRPRDPSPAQTVEKLPGNRSKPDAIMRQRGLSSPSHSLPDGRHGQRRTSGTVGDSVFANSSKLRGRAAWCTASPSGSHSTAIRHNSAPAGPSPASPVSPATRSPTSPMSLGSPSSPRAFGWPTRESTLLRNATPRGKFVPWVDSSTHKPGSSEVAKWNSDSRLSGSSSWSRGASNANQSTHSLAKRGSNQSSGVPSARLSRNGSAPSLTGDDSHIKAAGARPRRRAACQKTSSDSGFLHTASGATPVLGHSALHPGDVGEMKQHEGRASSSSQGASRSTVEVPPLQLGAALRKTGSCPGTPRVMAGHDHPKVAGSVIDDQSDQQTMLGDTPRSSVANVGQVGEGLHEAAKLLRTEPGQLSPEPAKLLHGQGPHLQGRSPNRHWKGGQWSSPRGGGSVDGDSTTTGGFEPETPQSCAWNDVHTLPTSSSPRPKGASPGMLDLEQDQRAMIMQWSREQAKTAADATQKSVKNSKLGTHLQGTPSGCDELLSYQELPADCNLIDVRHGAAKASADAGETVAPPISAEMNEPVSHVTPGAAVDCMTQLTTGIQEGASVAGSQRSDPRERSDVSRRELLAALPQRDEGIIFPGDSYAARRARDEGTPISAASSVSSSTSLQVGKGAGLHSSEVRRRQGDWHSVRSKAIPTFASPGAAGLPMTYAARRALDETAASTTGLLSDRGSAASSAGKARAFSSGSARRSGNDTPPSSCSPNSSTFLNPKFEGCAGLSYAQPKRQILDLRPENALHSKMMRGQALKDLFAAWGSSEQARGATSPRDCHLHLEHTAAGVGPSGYGEHGRPSGGTSEGGSPCAPGQGWTTSGVVGEAPAGQHSSEIGATDGRSVASALHYNLSADVAQMDVPSTTMRRTQENYTGGGPSVLHGALPVASARAAMSPLHGHYVGHRQQSPRASECSQTRVMPGESSDWPLQHHEPNKPFHPRLSVAGHPVQPRNLLHQIQITATQPTTQDFNSVGGCNTPSDTPSTSSTRQKYLLDVLGSAWGPNARRPEIYQADMEMKRMLGSKSKTCRGDFEGYADWKHAAGNYHPRPMSARGISRSCGEHTQDDSKGWAIPCVSEESLRYEEQTPRGLPRLGRSDEIQAPSDFSQKIALQRHSAILRYDSRSSSAPPPQSTWNPLTQQSPRESSLASSRAGKPSHASTPLLGCGTRPGSKNRHEEFSGSNMALAITNANFHNAAQERADRLVQDPVFVEQCLAMHRLKAEQTQKAASIKEKLETRATGVASLLQWG